MYSHDDGQRAALTPSNDGLADRLGNEILRSTSALSQPTQLKALPAPEPTPPAHERTEGVPVVQQKRSGTIRLTRKRPVPVAPPVEPAKRQMSTIQFPYVDLDGVIAVARAMLDNGGLPLTRDQMAGALRQAPGSGAFILKIGAARQFGLVEQNTAGKLALTDLGFAIASKDDARERAARAAAFLNVPLFRRAYDEFRGRQLPPRPLGLESAFVQFGVAPKQKDNARLVFEKSARQAGFFNVDPNRLIEPITSGLPSVEPVPVDAAAVTVQPAPQVAPDLDLDPLIRGLVDRLPEPGSVWAPEKRARWLQTLAANFDIVYETEAGDVVAIEVKAVRKTTVSGQS